jgi:lysine 2-monooxygenase
MADERFHEMSRDILDVAIIGGGVSGCYAAYRLLRADPELRPLQDLRMASGRDSLSVALYEASDRIGGRLWSYRFPDLPDQVAEMGGVAFSPLHANVYGLCTNELRLEIEEALEFSVYNLQYLRDHRFAFCEYIPNDQPNGYYPGTIPYFLREEEKWQLPTDLILSAFKKALPPEIGALFDRLLRTGGDPDKARKIISELDRALRNARTTGTHLPLPECGFWNLLTQHASQEAYEMATMSSGFYSTTQNWNAYDTMLGAFVDFSVPQKWTKLKAGYAALPLKMAQRFAELGGKICTKTRLYGLEIEGRDSEAVITMQLGTPGGSTWRQRARNVILAIPPRSVWLLNPDTFLFRSCQFVDDLSTVTCEPASKLFLTFAEPWWKKVGMPPKRAKNTIQTGQSATDLPMRLCYYLGSDNKNSKSLLLASFCDSIAVDYWNGYLPQNQFGLPDRATGGAQSHPVPLFMDDPPPAMVQDAVRQLTLVHGFEVPVPLCAKFVNWSADPYGGAFHFWNTHVRSWEVMPRIRRPVSGANLFLCGEAFSAKQGWVEGAINTAERTLETYFGLPRPTWTPEDYDFGP